MTEKILDEEIIFKHFPWDGEKVKPLLVKNLLSTANLFSIPSRFEHPGAMTCIMLLGVDLKQPLYLAVAENLMKEEAKSFSIEVLPFLAISEPESSRSAMSVIWVKLKSSLGLGEIEFAVFDVVPMQCFKAINPEGQYPDFGLVADGAFMMQSDPLYLDHLERLIHFTSKEGLGSVLKAAVDFACFEEFDNDLYSTAVFWAATAAVKCNPISSMDTDEETLDQMKKGCSVLMETFAERFAFESDPKRAADMSGFVGPVFAFENFSADFRKYTPADWLDNAEPLNIGLN